MNKKIFLLAIICCGIFSLAEDSQADNHYVTKAGSDSGNSCTNQGLPCLTITRGISQMSGGDTLIVGDGTYNEQITDMPSGSVGAYTTIQAQNLHGATVNGLGEFEAAIEVSYKSYVKVEGFKANGNGLSSSVVMAYESDHIKFIRLAAYNALDGYNTAVIDIGQSSYCLVEECWGWGTGRYVYINFWGDKNIFRRNVGRFDYTSDSLQCANFINYDSRDTVWQNNIALDSDTQYCDAINRHLGLYGGFFSENKNDRTDGIHDTSQSMDGNIVLNVNNEYYSSAGGYDHAGGHKTVDNHIMYHTMSGYFTEGATGVPPTHAMNHWTAGDIYGDYAQNDGFGGGGTGFACNNSGNTGYIKNSLFFNNNYYGIAAYVTSDYNAFYGNRANAGGSPTPSIGAHSITNRDPLANGLLYLPRIEAESYLSTAGESGTRIGAEVMWKIGIDETLYGESGYNTTRSPENGYGGVSDRLWPFPNQDLIKTDMSSYSGPGPTGARGFATGNSLSGSPQTLTKYIWEQLGNQIPDEIYGSQPSDTTAPTSPSGLNVQ